MAKMTIKNKVGSPTFTKLGLRFDYYAREHLQNKKIIAEYGWDYLIVTSGNYGTSIVKLCITTGMTGENFISIYTSWTISYKNIEKSIILKRCKNLDEFKSHIEKYMSSNREIDSVYDDNIVCMDLVDWGIAKFTMDYNI